MAGPHALLGTPLMWLEVEVGLLDSLGMPFGPGGGERRFVAITGGRVAFGDGSAGRVRAGGADWQWLRGDGVLEVDARYVIEDAQGAAIAIASRGLRHGPPEVIAALTRGEPVDPAAYYFRTALRFETAAPAWRHLNALLAIGTGERLPRCVRLAVHPVR